MRFQLSAVQPHFHWRSEAWSIWRGWRKGMERSGLCHLCSSTLHIVLTTHHPPIPTPPSHSCFCSVLCHRVEHLHYPPVFPLLSGRSCVCHPHNVVVSGLLLLLYIEMPVSWPYMLQDHHAQMVVHNRTIRHLHFLNRLCIVSTFIPCYMLI